MVVLLLQLDVVVLLALEAHCWCYRVRSVGAAVLGRG